MTVITSTSNRRVAKIAKLKQRRYRHRMGLTLCEGPTLLAEAVAAEFDVETIFALSDDQTSLSVATSNNIELVQVTSEVLSRLGSTSHPQSPISVIAIPPPTQLSGDCLWSELRDPGNAGTLLRSAAAFGLGFICGDSETVDVWSPKVIRAGAGAHFRIQLGTELPTSPYIQIGLVTTGGMSPRDCFAQLSPAEALLIAVGNEPHGLSESMSSKSDFRVTIPTGSDVESLNAAVAGSIMAYELAQFRQSKQ